MVVFGVVAAACSSGSDGAADEPMVLDPPTTITGELEVSVETGPVGDDDVSEVNFGSVETDRGFVLVEIPAEVIRTAGLTRDEFVGGGTFTLRLDSPSEQSDPQVPTYLVAELTPGG